MLVPQQVMAQDAPASQSAADDQDGTAIVVTAQRRTELARDVPLSVTALGGEQLQRANIIETSQLETLVPSLKIDRYGNFTLPSIRGVTPAITGVGLDSNISIYVDGVYQPSVAGNTFDLPDIDRIEVLKGPQGTLFGRNATGGTIRIVTRTPSYDPNGSMVASYGSYNDFSLKGYLNLPIVDERAALSVAGFYRSNDSYYRNVRPGGRDLEGDESRLLRARLRIDPTDNLQVIITGLYSRRKEWLAVYGNALHGNTIARLLDPAAIIPTRPYDVAMNDQIRPQVVTSRDVSANVQWDIGQFSVTSITSFLDRKISNVNDPDFAFEPSDVGFNYVVGARDRYFSQELNVTTDFSGPINLTGGLAYTNGRSQWSPLGPRTPAFSVTIFSDQDVEAAAAYAELTYKAAERLSVIAGVRYSWERRELRGDLLFGFAQPRPANLTPVAGQSWDSFTPRLSLRYELTPKSNVYFTYSQGFKSGVFNGTNVTQIDVADPETIRSYEVGFKGSIARGLTLDLSAFYYDYKDLQVTILETIGGVPISSLRNAASARIYGAEADLNYRFSPAFDIRAAASLLSAKYRGFADAIINVPCTNIPAPGQGCSVVGVPTNTGNANVLYDASGRRMIRAPSFTASVSANGHARLFEGNLDLTATLYYSSRVNFTVDGRINQPAYAKVDARIEWRPDNSPFSLAVFGRNLTDHATVAATSIAELGDGVSWAPPRVVGVEFGLRF